MWNNSHKLGENEESNGTSYMTEKKITTPIRCPNNYTKKLTETVSQSRTKFSEKNNGMEIPQQDQMDQ